MNPLLKEYWDIRLGNFSITIESLLFIKPWHDTIFMKMSGILIPNKLLYSWSSCLCSDVVPIFNSLNLLFNVHRLSELKIGTTFLHKHDDKDYNNLFGIGIPDILMNMVSCHGFINNNDSIVILKCPNRMSQYYFNKGFTEVECDKEHLKKFLI